MANDKSPFVAIIGGIWQLTDENKAKAKTVAAEIGAEFAKAGMGLVVYFSNEESLEPHLVSGYAKALPPAKGARMIKIRYAQSQTGMINFPEQEGQGHLFDRKLFPGDDWESPFYRSLVEADGVDAVLLLAGARSTLIAGQISVARPLPVLAIEKFGGSAAIIHRELAVREDGYPAYETHTAAQMVEWLKNKCAARAQKQAELRKMETNYKKHMTQTQKTFWAVFAFIVLLLILFYGAGKSPDPGNYPFLMITGLIAAGATGALVRSIIWGADETPPFTPLALGAIAGFCVGVAYMVPQFISGPVVLFLPDKTQEVPWSSKVQLISAVLVGISAGIGFDTVFTKIRKGAKDLPVEPR